MHGQQNIKIYCHCYYQYMLYMSILAPETFHSKDNFSTREKKKVGMILDGSWTGYENESRWKLCRNEYMAREEDEQNQDIFQGQKEVG